MSFFFVFIVVRHCWLLSSSWNTMSSEFVTLFCHSHHEGPWTFCLVFSTLFMFIFCCCCLLLSILLFYFSSSSSSSLSISCVFVGGNVEAVPGVWNILAFISFIFFETSSNVFLMLVKSIFMSCWFCSIFIRRASMSSVFLRCSVSVAWSPCVSFSTSSLSFCLLRSCALCWLFHVIFYVYPKLFV